MSEGKFRRLDLHRDSTSVARKSRLSLLSLNDTEQVLGQEAKVSGASPFWNMKAQTYRNNDQSWAALEATPQTGGVTLSGSHHRMDCHQSELLAPISHLSLDAIP